VELLKDLGFDGIDVDLMKRQYVGVVLGWMAPCSTVGGRDV
jgi:hypothetical protein